MTARQPLQIVPCAVLIASLVCMASAALAGHSGLIYDFAAVLIVFNCTIVAGIALAKGAL